MNIEQTAARTKGAAIRMAALDSDIKNKALEAVIQALKTGQAKIAAANQQDLDTGAKLAVEKQVGVINEDGCQITGEVATKTERSGLPVWIIRVANLVYTDTA